VAQILPLWRAKGEKLEAGAKIATSCADYSDIVEINNIFYHCEQNNNDERV
jgi:hypothetical protein